MIGPCVSLEELTSFNMGELPEARIEQIAEHLEACPRCAEAAGGLESTSDSFVQDVRAAGAVGGPILVRAEKSSATPSPFAKTLSLAEGQVPSGAREDRSATELPRQVGDYEILGELGRGGMGVVYRHGIAGSGASLP